MNITSCLPLRECSRQLTTGAHKNAQLSRHKNLHDGAASSLCAMHDPRMPTSAYGMCMCVRCGAICVSVSGSGGLAGRGQRVYVYDFLIHSIVCKGVYEFFACPCLFLCARLRAVFVHPGERFNCALSSKCDKRQPIRRGPGDLFDVFTLTLCGM